MDYVYIILMGWIIGLIAAVPIGPVNLVCIRRTLQCGSGHGFVAGLGAALGDGIFACIAGFSLTAISQLIRGFTMPLQIVGGLLLMVVGIRMFIAPPPARIAETYGPLPEGAPNLCTANGNGASGGASSAKAMATTFALTITNPATFMGFTAYATSLSGLNDNPSFFSAAFWVIGVVVGSVTWWLSLTTVVGKLHARIDDHVVQTINRISGVLVAIFGLAVLIHVAFPHLI